jgi:hypothetical protein
LAIILFCINKGCEYIFVVINSKIKFLREGMKNLSGCRVISKRILLEFMRGSLNRQKKSVASVEIKPITLSKRVNALNRGATATTLVPGLMVLRIFQTCYIT